jgi:C-terminal processing protease CtpA/Prc
MPQKPPIAALAMVAVAALAALPVFAEPPAASPEKERFSPVAVRADLGEMYQRLEASHYDLFARRPKAEYDAKLAEMLKSIDRPMSLLEVEILFQKFAAYGRVAHSRVDLPAGAFAAFHEGKARIMPLAVRIVEEQGGAAVYVAENASGESKIAPGDRLLEIDGEKAAAVVARLETNISADNAYLAHTQLEPRFALLLWLELGERRDHRLRLKRGQDAPFEVTLPARTRPEILAAREKLPKVAELDWDRREAKMLDGGIAYLRPGPFYDNRPEAANMWDPSAFHQFVDDAFRQFQAAGAKKLLIDLRKNPGGDDSFSNRMVAWFADEPFRFAKEFKIKVSEASTASNRQRLEALEASTGNEDNTSRRLAAAYAGQKNGAVVRYEIPENLPREGDRFKGEVYLLIDRQSYSNTANVAALVQDYGFGKILGEETSDLATTYGAMEQFQLSRTGIMVGFPKALILRPSGNLDPRGVIPDIAIESPLVPGKGDPMLEKALEIVSKER